jgi:hypothetical protein
MYAADHEKLFGASAKASLAPVRRLANVDLQALNALGRRERSRQFARLIDQAKAATKRLFD